MYTSIAQLYKLYKLHSIVETDTRKIKTGCIFFALKGPNFNGNTFAKTALQLGASFAVIDEPIDSNNPQFLLVENVLEALQNLALHHRQQFNIPFIAITGSNGKTTTKELVNVVLASHFITYTTQGNLNNHIGVPLTILSVKPNAQIAVIEMGANHQKEIESYCNYTLPTHGIITNCGKAHLEGFGGVEGVKKGKGELFDFLKNNKGVAFIYSDYSYLHSMCQGIENVIEFGTNDGMVVGDIESSDPFLKVKIKQGLLATSVATQLVGSYNISNVLTAIAIGKYFNVPDEKIVAAIENYTPSNSRSQLIKIGGNAIILDAYNANPSSMVAAINNFANVASNHKILLLGSMMELGEDSIAEHQNLIDIIGKYAWQQVVLVGENFKNCQHNYLYFDTSGEAKNWFFEKQFTNCNILIKGSRSMKMETILDK
jgi:UDP-N-acetylmuramoyl-tripeptide--D-alanyl-D-alanine ligase